jgi:hypothetical protein
MLEIKDHADTHAGNAEIIQHESTFVIGDLVDYLCIYDQRIESD